ncbi:MAG: bifunctional heptose 7-phosphate kinase/heptose 1-phosphate adenyltransferase [Pseudomonadota bacterium]
MSQSEDQAISFDQTASIAVVGDVMLDEFRLGAVTRVSPEAPVPVFQLRGDSIRAGGAANVANNILALGGRCTLFGLTGPGDRLPDLLHSVGIDARLTFDAAYTPIVKTRYLSQNQQLFRVDQEDGDYRAGYDVDAVAGVLRDFDIVIVSDYAKGFVTPALMDRLRAAGARILVDPKHITKALYRDVYLLKPNVEETRQALGEAPTDDMSAASCASRFHAEYGCNVLITRGADGMSLYEGGANPMHVPAVARAVFDVTGAGDTVIATIALAVASGHELANAVRFANVAASIVVSKLGTETTSLEELRAGLSRVRGKTRSRAELAGIVRQLQRAGKRVVFTNGCFDILHVGHAQLLRAAGELGDVLILGLNSDASVQRLKGPERPINSAEHRAEMLSCLESVDYLTFFDEDDPRAVLEALRPDVHVKGGDYDPDDPGSMPEATTVRSYGGEVRVVPLLEGQSTSGLVSRIRS